MRISLVQPQGDSLLPGKIEMQQNRPFLSGDTLKPLLWWTARGSKFLPRQRAKLIKITIRLKIKLITSPGNRCLDGQE